MISKQPFYEHGFWWWFDPATNDYRIGPSPQFQVPSWSAQK
jgi:hypothetical protein